MFSITFCYARLLDVLGAAFPFRRRERQCAGWLAHTWPPTTRSGPASDHPVLVGQFRKLDAVAVLTDPLLPAPRHALPAVGQRGAAESETRPGPSGHGRAGGSHRPPNCQR